jgi:hypothetical protein
VNVCSPPIVDAITVKRITGFIIGITMRHNVCQRLAPSTVAASSTSPGMACSLAR